MTANAQRCARAVIEYDGTAFAGSQVQPNARTVQGELEKALNRLIGETTRVRLAGRTDAGVHATGQVAAFCYARAPRRGGGLPELRRRLNAALPPDLSVRSLRPATAGFDPRREARWRVYRYRIGMNGVRHPLDRHRTLEIDEPLDVARHAGGSGAHARRARLRRHGRGCARTDGPASRRADASCGAGTSSRFA